MNHYIKNFDTLAKTPARKDALSIVEAGYAAIDTDAALRAFVTLQGDTLHVGDATYDLAQYERVFIVGCGKVACRAAATLESILKGKVSGGAVIGVSDITCDVVHLYKGTHPKPSGKNFAAAEHMLRIGSSITERDLVLAIVGGGGSSLLCASQNECDQGARLYESFLGSGGIIEELNVVRQHISPLKGGGLAKALYPATIVGLIFSDVPGGDPSAVASGPTYFDDSTVEDAQRVIQKYNLGDYELIETPKDKKYFENVHNVEVVSNRTAIGAMAQRARELGYAVQESACNPYELTTDTIACLVGEARPNSVVLLGCEPRLVVPDECEGEGGRMSYLALEALEVMRDNQVCVAAASDGRDNSDFAGAIADNETRKALGVHHVVLDDYKVCRDSNPVFRFANDLIDTGVIEANVSDLVLLLTPKV